MRVRPSALPLVTLVLLLLTGALPTGRSATAQELAPVDLRAVDSIFGAFDGEDTPGCAVGASIRGEPVLLRAYGMADLEHGVPNTPTTIFEPGSVSKQFTAAATILLALDGAISLDDDVRTYIPELPDYGETITIRHLLNHTSGLRDWGSVAGIEGWPRTRRAHEHIHVLDIAGRQGELNYPPGRYYSYTNTGYNLQAILVSRVSGMSFAEFSKRRIFEPLGMTRTQWRDDFNRIVKDRAIAYRPHAEEGWSMLMPFENIHGNGGLLTTVGDLLKFTRNLETGELGGPEFIREMHRQGVLTSGEEISYASGLVIGEHRGLPEVSHSGSTAGYRGHLSRFPEQGLALAVMCNAANGNAGGHLYQVADLYLEELLPDGAEGEDEGGSSSAAQEARAAVGQVVSQARLQALAGGYRDERRGTLTRLVFDEGILRLGRTPLVPLSETRFRVGDDGLLEFEDAPSAHGRPAASLDTEGSPPIRLDPVPAFEPTEAELAHYLGTYRSDEAEATYTVAMEEGEMVIRDRWGRSQSVRPLYPDAFGTGRGTVIFRRGASGAVTGFSLSQSRVWDLQFRKVE